MTLLIPFLLAPILLINSSRPLDEAEGLWMASKFTESNRMLEEILASDPRNSEALWRVARNYYDSGESLPMSARDERYRLALATEDWGRRCLKADPDNGNCYFWVGVGIGRQGTVRGILSQIRHAKEVHDLWQKALRLAKPYRSRDGTANIPGDDHLALAIFYRLIPDWWIAQLLLGVRGNIDTSVDHLRSAVALEPQRMEYVKELGVSLLCRWTKKKDPHDLEEGKAYLEKTQILPLFKGYDKVDREHARLILTHPEMACGYSRDGQQEYTEKEAVKAFKNR